MPLAPLAAGSGDARQVPDPRSPPREGAAGLCGGPPCGRSNRAARPTGGTRGGHLPETPELGVPVGQVGRWSCRGLPAPPGGWGLSSVQAGGTGSPSAGRGQLVLRRVTRPAHPAHPALPTLYPYLPALLTLPCPPRPPCPVCPPTLPTPRTLPTLPCPHIVCAKLTPVSEQCSAATRASLRTRCCIPLDSSG